MARFRLSRRGFIRDSASVATLGLAACSGGAAVGGSPVPSSGSSSPSHGATATPGAGVTASPTPSPTTSPTTSPSSTSTPGTTAAFPSGSVSTGTRGPNSLPDSTKPAGTVNTALPFDTVIIVMMENHSFDNYFGMLPLRGQPLADGFTFDANGNPLNKNPLKSGGYQQVFHLVGTCQPNGVNQDWDATHTQINNGAMDGFPQTDTEAMGYWDESDIPFYYSLAKTFCLGNRAFCSIPGQTYPNRRTLYSGTPLGTVSSSADGFELPAPANGTLMDMLTKYGVTWKNYFTDLPCLAIIPQTVENHPTNFASIAEFFVDAAAGTLPNVCFVDPEMGGIDDVGGNIDGYLNSINPPPSIASVMNTLENESNAQGQDEENPQDIALGEAFVSRVVNAVMQSPQWRSTLLIWTYDEHGGYYDHVPPLGAVKPDNIPPNVAANDMYGGYNITGIRIPTVVVSPYSRPNSVSNVPHDHTSIIATIAAKWNLPALTYRDAQANTLLDYLNLSGPPAFLNPPTLAAPSKPTIAGGSVCEQTPPPVVVSPNQKHPRKP